MAVAVPCCGVTAIYPVITLNQDDGCRDRGVVQAVAPRAAIRRLRCRLVCARPQPRVSDSVKE